MTPQTDALDTELHAPGLLADRYADMRDLARELERKLAEVTAQRDGLAVKLADVCVHARNLAQTMQQHAVVPIDNGTIRRDLAIEGKYLLVVTDTLNAIARAEKEAE